MEQQPTKALNAKALQATGMLAVAMAPTITAQDVAEADAAITAYQAASKAKNEAEKRKDKALSLIFEKALGVNKLDEVKVMTLSQIMTQFNARVKAGLVKVKTPFEIKQLHQTTTIAYKEELIAAKGQAYVMGLQGKDSFTYAVVAISKK